MGEFEPSKRRRPEGVGQDWLTKQQAMTLADIRSDRSFKLFADQLRGSMTDDIVEEGKFKPTWVSPQFAEELKKLNSVPEVTPDMHMMPANALVSFIGCGSGEINEWIELCPPLDEAEAHLLRALNGWVVMHYSEDYADRLRAYKLKHSDSRPRRSELPKPVSTQVEATTASEPSVLPQRQVRAAERVSDTSTLEYIARCDKQLDNLNTYMRTQRPSGPLHDKLSTVRFQLETFQRRLHQGEAIAVTDLLIALNRAALLMTPDRDDD